MSDELRRSMSVTGIGRVSAPPDVLALRMSVETEAATVSEALGKNNALATAVMSALEEHGVKESDLQTTDLSIDPVWEPRGPNDTRPPKIIGYRARNALVAKLRDLEVAGSAIDAAARAGGDATRVDGISFSFDDPASLLVEARKRAIDDAKAKAKQLTEGFGARLGGVISISESRMGGPRPILDFAMAERAAPPTPIAAGEEEVALQVAVEYELTAGSPGSKETDDRPSAAASASEGHRRY